MAAPSPLTVIKIEQSPEPPELDSLPDAFTPLDVSQPAAPQVVIDPKDPEGFMRRCSGHNKKTRTRCGAVIGKNAKHSHPTFLPTCYAHRDQQKFAGWCQFKEED